MLQNGERSNKIGNIVHQYPVNVQCFSFPPFATGRGSDAMFVVID